TLPSKVSNVQSRNASSADRRTSSSNCFVSFWAMRHSHIIARPNMGWPTGRLILNQPAPRQIGHSDVGSGELATGPTGRAGSPPRRASPMRLIVFPFRRPALEDPFDVLPAPSVIG